MRSTILWIVIIALLGGSYVVAHASDEADAPLIASCAVTALIVAALAAASATCLRSRWPWALFLVGLAVARGLSAGAHMGREVWPAVTPGRARGLVPLEIVDASWPGAWCAVEARAGDRTVGVELPRGLCPLWAGDRVVVPTDVWRVRSGAELPGDEDVVTRAMARGVDFTATADAVWLVARGGEGYWSWVARSRQAAWEQTRGDPGAAFVASTLLGLRTGLAPDARADLAAAGLGHLVAVSGMQVSLVALFAHRQLLRALANTRGPLFLPLVLSLVPLIGYVGLVGAEAPAVRSAIMVIAVGLGAVLGRPAHGVAVLAWSAVAMLAWRPAWITDVGFQLSVVAMAALVRSPIGAGLLHQSWRVAWAVLPIVAFHFGQTGAWAVLTNLVAVPVFTYWVVPLGVLGAAFVPWFGGAAWAIAGWGGALELDLARVFASLPALSLEALAVFAALTVLVRTVPMGRLRRWVELMPSRPVAVAAIAAALVPEAAAPPPPSPGRWYATGNGAQPMVIVAADDQGHACIRDPSGMWTRWPARLRALGFAAVVEVELDRPHTVDGMEDGAAEVTPHVDEFRVVLDRAGMGAADDDAVCHYPARKRVVAAVRACRLRLGRSRVFVAADGANLRCWDGDRWRDADGLD